MRRRCPLDSKKERYCSLSCVSPVHFIPFSFFLICSSSEKGFLHTTSGTFVPNKKDASLPSMGRKHPRYHPNCPPVGQPLNPLTRETPLLFTAMLGDGKKSRKLKTPYSLWAFLSESTAAFSVPSALFNYGFYYIIDLLFVNSQ